MSTCSSKALQQKEEHTQEQHMIIPLSRPLLDNSIMNNSDEQTSSETQGEDDDLSCTSLQEQVQEYWEREFDQESIIVHHDDEAEQDDDDDDKRDLERLSRLHRMSKEEGSINYSRARGDVSTATNKSVGGIADKQQISTSTVLDDDDDEDANTTQAAQEGQPPLESHAHLRQPGAYAMYPSSTSGSVSISSSSLRMVMSLGDTVDARSNQAVESTRSRSLPSPSDNNEEASTEELSSTSSSSLARAKPVSDAEPIFEARNVQRDLFRRRLLVLALLAGLFVSLLVAISVSLIMTRQGQSSEDSMDPRCSLPIEERSVPIDCMCFNTTQKFLDYMNDDEWTAFEVIRDRLISLGILSINNMVGVEDCNPENQLLLSGSQLRMLNVSLANMYGAPDRHIAISYGIFSIYIYMGGVHWVNDAGWLKSINACTFYGVDCMFTNVFSGVSLPGNNLVGTLPETLRLLTSFRTIDFSENPGIVGSIPSGITAATSLKTLDLSRTSLSGEIPSVLGSMTTLDELNLAHSAFEGSIPSELGMLPLRSLGLAWNHLEGPIPTELGNLSRLQILRLQYNQLTGQLPDSLSNLSQLELLDLESNNLDGSLPSFFAIMPRLEMISFGASGLKGTIPELFCTNDADIRNLVTQCSDHGMCSCCVPFPRQDGSVSVQCLETTLPVGQRVGDF